MAEDQTVTDTDSKPNGAGKEGTDARTPQDDLDALLKEFDKPATSTAAKPDTTASTTAVTPDVAKQVEALTKVIADDRFTREITPVIKGIRGDVPADVMSDEELIDWLDGQAKRDPRIRNAWDERATNPKAFAKVVDALGKTFAGKFKKLPDAAASEDAAAVAAAVRGASTRAPEGKPPDYSKMSNSEFAQDVEKKFGFRPF